MTNLRTCRLEKSPIEPFPILAPRTMRACRHLSTQTFNRNASQFLKIANIGREGVKFKYGLQNEMQGVWIPKNALERADRAAKQQLQGNSDRAKILNLKNYNFGWMKASVSSSLVFCRCFNWVCAKWREEFFILAAFFIRSVDVFCSWNEYVQPVRTPWFAGGDATRPLATHRCRPISSRVSCWSLISSFGFLFDL